MNVDDDKNTNARVPAEWEKQERIWVGNVRLQEEWNVPLQDVQHELSTLTKILSEFSSAAMADQELFGPYGDCWLRDTGPIFSFDNTGTRQAHRFTFNGWGEKYAMPGDELVAKWIADNSDIPLVEHDFIFEGGALEVDGQGCALATVSTLVGEKRNRCCVDAALSYLKNRLYLNEIYVLDACLLNDHTDGHIDTLVRFVKPGHVLCAEPSVNDPNRATLVRLKKQLGELTDHKGKSLSVSTIPSPGAVHGPDGNLLAVSYTNYIISNDVIIVPQYQTQNDLAAVQAIAKLFPEHKVVGSSSVAMVTGGGSFHCATNQVPAA